MRYVSNAKGDKVVISRSGEVMIADDNGRERERHKVPYGALLAVAAGDTVRAGKQLANWDPHHRPIITEYAGTVKFEHVEEGTTVAKQIDDVTGLSTLVAFQVVRRGVQYGIERPAREVLYTVVSAEEKYKAKSFIDTVVFRGGDAASIWAYGLVQAAAVPGAAVTAVMLLLCAGWSAVALFLARRHGAMTSVPRGAPEVTS
jgi:hypothetical protein